MAEIFLTIFVQKVLDSTIWHLRNKIEQITEVSQWVEELKTNFQSIMAVLEDAEKGQTNEATVKVWLKKIKDVAYDVDDVLDEWNISLLEYESVQDSDKPCIMCFVFHKVRQPMIRLQLHSHISNRISKLNVKLHNILRDKEHFSFMNTIPITSNDLAQVMTSSDIQLSEVCGRKEEVKCLVDTLVHCRSGGTGITFNTFHIVGMGGIGKTTLAQVAYNDLKVSTYFDLKSWICVSDPFEESRVMKAILESVGIDAQNITQLNVLADRIKKALHDKRFLLVLDDVWTIDYQKWERVRMCLENGKPGSKILITTRKEDVVQMMGAEDRMITLELLSEEVCWSIFSKIAFFNRERTSVLENIGRQLARKCKGLPLIAKILGSFLRLKNHEDQWNDILTNELWHNENIKEKVFVPFLLSYRDLPPLEKACVAYCCIFPKDHEIDRDDLITMWMSQGFFSRTNLEEQDVDSVKKYFKQQAILCFENLAMRSFFQEFKKDCDGRIVRCKMHDLIHDFLQYISSNEYFELDTFSRGKKVFTVNQGNEKARHATLLLASGARIPESVSRKKYLRTLYVVSLDNDSTFLNLNFDNFRCLRTIHLFGACVTTLSKGIKMLIHLRYLSLAENNHLKELPEELCDLFNLMTLRIIRCNELQSWPKRMSRLKNLRYLYVKECDKLKGVPGGLDTWDTKVIS